MDLTTKILQSLQDCYIRFLLYIHFGHRDLTVSGQNTKCGYIILLAMTWYTNDKWIIDYIQQSGILITPSYDLEKSQRKEIPLVFWNLQSFLDFPFSHEGFEEVDKLWGQNGIMHEIDS